MDHLGRLSDELDRREEAFVDSLRVAGLKRGQENALVEEVRDLHRLRRKWHSRAADAVSDAVDDADEQRRRVDALKEDVEAAEADRDSMARDVKRLTVQLRETEAEMRDSLQAAAARHDERAAALHDEHQEWRRQYLEQSKKSVEAKLSAMRDRMVAERDAAVEATLQKLESEYRTAMGKNAATAGRAEAEARAMRERTEAAEAQRLEAVKAASNAKAELAALTARAEEAGKAHEEELYQVKKRLGSATYKLQVLQLETKTNGELQELARHKLDHVLSVAEDKHRAELSELKRRHAEELDAVEQRVRRVVGEKVGVIAALQADLARQTKRAAEAERLLQRLDSGLQNVVRVRSSPSRDDGATVRPDAAVGARQHGTGGGGGIGGGSGRESWAAVSSPARRTAASPPPAARAARHRHSPR